MNNSDEEIIEVLDRVALDILGEAVQEFALNGKTDKMTEKKLQYEVVMSLLDNKINKK